MVVAGLGGGEERQGELLFNEYRVSVLRNGKSSGESCILPAM